MVSNVETKELHDSMETFFLSETLKYLYLLFDTENFIHQGDFTFTTEVTEEEKGRGEAERRENRKKRKEEEKQREDKYTHIV